MRNKEIYRKIGIILIAVITTIGLSINLDGGNFCGNHVIYIAISVLLWQTFSKVVTIEDKRAKICCLILSGIFALCEVVGLSIMKYNNLSLIIGSKMAMLKSMIKFLSYTAIFYSVILLLFTKLIPKIRHIKIF